MKIGQFLRETKIEMNHVVWPTRTRAFIYTLVVIVLSLGIGYLLGGFDIFFRGLLKGIIQ